MSGGAKGKHCRALLPDHSFRGPETSFYFFLILAALFHSEAQTGQGNKGVQKVQMRNRCWESAETTLGLPTAICFSTLNTPRMS